MITQGGFVLFRLYHNLNIQYPPILSATIIEVQDEEADDGQDEVQRDRVSALNQSLARTVVETDDDKVEIDNIDTGLVDDPSKLEAAKEEAEKIKKLQNLFQGMKFFLGREIPREPLDL